MDYEFLIKMGKISNGNPGAISVIYKLIESGRFDALEKMQEMEMVGPQVWVGYRDFCHQNIHKFAECVSKKDEEMIALCNRECPNLPPIK